MTRRKLGRLRAEPPDARTAEKYLLWMSGRDLARDPRSYPRVSSESLFGDDLPLKLEVGCGSGEFLCSLARNESDVNFVGFDLHMKSLYKAIETASSQALDNILFVSADFQLVYPLLVQDSLGAVYLHFPDPGMKPAHRKRRIFSERFLDEMHHALKPGGRISVVTDEAGYLEEMLDLAERDHRWDKTHEERFLIGFEPEVKSRFQQLWERGGRQPLRFELSKRHATNTERARQYSRARRM